MTTLARLPRNLLAWYCESVSRLGSGEKRTRITHTDGEVAVTLPRWVDKAGFYRSCLMADERDRMGHVQMRALHGMPEGRS